MESARHSEFPLTPTSMVFVRLRRATRPVRLGYRNSHRQVACSLTRAEYDAFAALALAEGRRPTTLATALIRAHLAHHGKCP